MARLLAFALCLVLGWSLRPSAKPVVVTLPDPPRTVPEEPDPSLRAFLTGMTADDLVRGLWARRADGPVDPALRAQLTTLADTRRKVETLRASRRRAREAWLHAAAPLAERCR